LSYCASLYPFQVAISKDDTVIFDGAGDKKAIEERCEQFVCCNIVLVQGDSKLIDALPDV
ncbi:hypothetical protein Taro_054518, partial [Colocasia esculenta]|nr:hypothetical protein [Colocasia esculenta]